MNLTKLAGLSDLVNGIQWENLRIKSEISGFYPEKTNMFVFSRYRILARFYPEIANFYLEIGHFYPKSQSLSQSQDKFLIVTGPLLMDFNHFNG